MTATPQASLLSPLTDVAASSIPLADLHDDVQGKVARFHQLADLSTALGSSGTMLPSGETAFAAWTEARSSFVHGNFVATVLLNDATFAIGTAIRSLSMEALGWAIDR